MSKYKIQMRPFWWFSNNVYVPFLLFIISFPAGIEEQLKYIKELGFDSIWLSPIYEDGGKDMGNDVKNHNKVDIDYTKIR